MRVLLLTLILAATLHAVEKPNVLFIAVDDLNDWVGPLGGHPQAKTPNFDRLAAQGTTFLNAHCQAPLCNPSRTSLLTGLRPGTTGVYALEPWIRTMDAYKDYVTLPQAFHQAGYKTYSAGKIFHGGFGRGKKDQEFDEMGPGASGAPFPPQKLVNTPAANKLVDWGVFDHQDEDKGDWAVASYAVSVLDSKPQGPFFLSAGFFLPHVPCYTTQKWFDMYPAETTKLAPILPTDREDTPRSSWFLHWKLPEPRLKFLQEDNQLMNLTRSYLACISFMDSQVGRVLDALERNGYAENTVVVLWSDHGWHLGEKLITGKNTLWDRSTRVPLIFAGPGIAKGAKCGRPAELLDLYPTLTELCGLAPNAKLEGLSLAPQLKDAKAPRDRPAMTSQGPGNYGVRSEQWRYIRYADGAEELYDMVKDPNEWENLAGNAELAAVKAELAKWIPKTDAAPAPGSKSRLLERTADGRTFWEGEEIGAGDPVPEL